MPGAGADAPARPSSFRMPGRPRRATARWRPLWPPAATPTSCSTHSAPTGSAEPAPDTVHDLALGLFDAGPWRGVAPLRLFGHSMGAVVAFEFARIAESHGAAVQRLWVSAGPAPSAVAAMPELPTSRRRTARRHRRPRRHRPRTACRRRVRRTARHRGAGRLPGVQPLRAALPASAFGADIRVLGGARRPPRRSRRRCGSGRSTPPASFELFLYDGGHFYLNDHVEAVAAQVNADA